MGAFGRIEGNNLYSAKGQVKQVVADNLKVSDYSVQFKLPDTLEIFLIERKAKFAFKNADRSNFVMVNKDGMVISYAEVTNLPHIIIANGEYKVGDRVEDDTLFSLELLFDVYSVYKVRSAKLRDDSLVIELVQGTNVIFPKEGDRKVLVGSLNLMMSAFNSIDSQTEAGNVNIREKTIDLRYNNPVIR
jgi:cell division septal protein FtsQ